MGDTSTSEQVCIVSVVCSCSKTNSLSELSLFSYHIFIFGTKAEIDELDFSALDAEEGEFDFSKMPPFLSIVKIDALHMCCHSELMKGAMCRWDPVIIVLTEKMLFVHKIDEARYSRCLSEEELVSTIMGDVPCKAIVLQGVEASLLLHPVFADAFEISKPQRMIFLTKSSHETSSWLDAILRLSPAGATSPLTAGDGGDPSRASE